MFLVTRAAPPCGEEEGAWCDVVVFGNGRAVGAARRAWCWGKVAPGGGPVREGVFAAGGAAGVVRSA
eukprot:6130072-Prorocentrum_lima.AAC.1